MKKIFLSSLGIIFFLFSPSFAQTWLKVSAGAEFSLAIRSDGTLWAWGFNGNGQLGLGSVTESNSPVQVGTNNDWADIATGAIHAFAIKKDGSLWAWGYNTDGELGDGTTTQETLPLRIGTDTDWESISASMQASFAIKKNHTLWAWGYNTDGELGDGNTISQLKPVMIGADTDWIVVCGGGYHAMAMKSDHSIWSWGYNGNGQTGYGMTQVIDSSAHQIGTDKNWAAISCGFEFSLGIKSDGSLWSWGFNGNGQLGNGTTDNDSLPNRIGTDNDWKSIAAGASFAFAIKNDGSLWGWGYNGESNLGDGSTAQQISPELIGTDKDWLMISAAKGLVSNNQVFGLHTLALHQDAKEICAAGANYAGQIGNGTTTNAIVFDCSVGVLSAVAEVPAQDVMITVTPNPSSDIVTISAKGLSRAHLEIYDMPGTRIYSSNFNDEKIWRASDYNLSSGIYILRITGTDSAGKIFTGSKLIAITK